MPYSKSLRTLSLTAMAAVMLVATPLAIASANDVTTKPGPSVESTPSVHGKKHSAHKHHLAKKDHKAVAKKVDDKAAAAPAADAKDYKTNQ